MSSLHLLGSILVLSPTLLSGCHDSSSSDARSAVGSRERFAIGLGVLPEQVVVATDIEVDGRLLGVMGRFTREGRTRAALTWRHGDPVMKLAEADELWSAGIVDLAASARLKPKRRSSAPLRATGMKQPAILFASRLQEEVKASSNPKTIGATKGGTREATVLYVVGVRPFPRMLLWHEIGRRSEDGFGGHDVQQLALRQEQGKTFLEGMRQDRLPARQARCLEPDPVPVRFELVDGRFRALPTPSADVGCR